MSRRPVSDFSPLEYERKTLHRDGETIPLIVFYGIAKETVEIDMEKVIKDLHFELPTEENPQIEILLHFVSEHDLIESILKVSIS